MKRRQLIWLAFSVTLVAASWSIPNNQLTAMIPATATTSNCTPIGRIINVENDSQTTVGRQLCAGDRLQFQPIAKITILCYHNGEIRNLDAGCPQVLAATRCNPKNPRECGGNPRGPGEILQAIAPRSTSLLNDRPMLSWLPVQGANSYIVRVIGPGVNWENPPVKDTKLAYPLDAPTLQPGRQYDLIIQSDNDKVGKATFRMLSENDANMVRSLQAKIINLNLPKYEQAIELARLYTGKKLIAEAIEILAAVKNNTQKAIVYQMLGDRYLQIELPVLAKPEYEQALKLATQAQNVEEQAAAQYGLGIANATIKNSDEGIRLLKAAWTIYATLNNTELKTDVAHFLGEVYVNLKNRDEAIRWFEEALKGYEILKNSQGIEAMQTQIERLKHN